MTVDAGSSPPIAGLDRPGMMAAIVSRLLVPMALRAGNCGRRGSMGRCLDVGMAFDAGQHAAVDGILECFRVDVETHRFPVDVFRHVGIAMASQAFVVGGLRYLCAGDGREQNQKQTQGSEFPKRWSGPSARASFSCRHVRTTSRSQTPLAVPFLGTAAKGAVSHLTRTRDSGHKPGRRGLCVIALGFWAGSLQGGPVN